MEREKIEIDLNDDFAKAVAAQEVIAPKYPMAIYNPDGDCIEFLVSDADYYAERMDQLVTIYKSQADDQLVGALIKGVKRFIAEALKESPGFRIEIKDQTMRLEWLFTRVLWKEGDECKQQVYEVLRNAAHDCEADVELGELCA